MAEQYDENANYRVKLLKPIEWGPRALRPDEKHIFSGAALNSMQDNPDNKGAFGEVTKIEE